METKVRLPDVGEQLVIHGLVYKMRKHTMKHGNIPKDIILRLVGIYVPPEPPSTLTPPPPPPPPPGEGQGA